jgi:uncharacterized protein
MSTKYPLDASIVPAPEEVAARALQFLESHNCVSLATDGPDGLWAATVFYVNDAFELYFLSRSDTRHVRNIEANPRVAATISDDVAHWLNIRGLQLEGSAKLVDERLRPRVLAAFRRRYAFADSLWWTNTKASVGSQECVYRIEPARVLFVDHGFRDTRSEVPAGYLRRHDVAWEEHDPGFKPLMRAAQLKERG